MQLSGVIITYNEERNISRCLASLRDVCDEILVLDSFSTDQTEAICRSFGVRFEQHPFEGHIQQKNEALQRAWHPWVLSLDADEALSPALKEAILALKKNAPQAGGFSMNRLTNYCGKWIHYSGWYPDVKLRLFYKANAYWGGINPHDQLMLKGNTLQQHLKGDLLHYSYYTKEDHYKQIAYFSEIASKELFARKIKTALPLIILKVAAQFMKSYLFKLGFFDGIAGWHIATRSAYATYLKYTLLRKLWQHA